MDHARYLAPPGIEPPEGTSFVIRLWLEGWRDETPEWRFQARHIQSDAETQGRYLHELLAFIESQASVPVASLGVDQAKVGGKTDAGEQHVSRREREAGMRESTQRVERQGGAGSDGGPRADARAGAPERIAPATPCEGRKP